MNKKITLLYYLIGASVKVVFSLLFTNYLVAIAYTTISTMVYYFISKRFKMGKFLPILISDYLIAIYLTYGFEFNVMHLLLSTIYFIAANGVIYGVMISYIAKDTTFKTVRSRSNEKVDLGIKALESDKYDDAFDLFKEAIREHKTNYLGYMGMCNTLTKMNKRDEREFSRYRKKCIKYAPRNLKGKIKDKLY